MSIYPAQGQSLLIIRGGARIEQEPVFHDEDRIVSASYPVGAKSGVFVDETAYAILTPDGCVCSSHEQIYPSLAAFEASLRKALS